jgi:hypothetical protein
MSAPKVLILGGTEFMGRALINELKLIKDKQPESTLYNPI